MVPTLTPCTATPQKSATLTQMPPPTFSLGRAGLGTALTYLGVPRVSALLSPIWSPSQPPTPAASPSPPASRSSRVPGAAGLNQAAENHVGAARRLLSGAAPSRVARSLRPPAAERGSEEGGSGALTPPPPSPRANQKIRGSGSDPRSSPGKRSATPRPAARGETPKRRAGSHSGPLRSPRHRALGDAGWGPPEQLCSLLPRFPPEIPPYPSLGAQMERRFPGSKRDNHTPGGLKCPTPKLKALVFSVSAIA